MRDALLKVQARLDEKIDYLATKSRKDKAIYINNDGVVPEISNFPAIALKDGPAKYTVIGGKVSPTAVADEFTGKYEKEFTIEVTGFIEMLRDEGITGDGVEKGILEFIEDIKAALAGWLPDATTYTEPLLPLSEEGSQVLMDEEEQVYIQFKTITFSCMKQE